MAEDLMGYAQLAQDALRGVVKAALERAAEEGLPGEHHFYIAFATNAPGVEISDTLRERYPEEMTIVLQHQFWGLVVRRDRFEVGLSFNNVPEKLVIPFSALRGFYDPSVQFGLQFEAGTSDIAEAGLLAEAASDNTEGAARPADDEEEPPSEEPKDDGEKMGDVVSLDAFRKK